MSSIGAASAAQQGRGTRNFGSEDPDYQVLLPQLPTGRIVLNTLFLHADVRARPYRVEHFRDALASLGVLPDVIALGAYQMSHVWAVTFKSDEGVKRLASAKEVKVNEHRCIVVDPANQAVRLKLHWMLHNVTDEDIRTALSPYGKVMDVFREKWRVHGVQDKASSTRAVSLVLKTGMTVEDLPHQLRVAGEQALVVVPGRAPLCLKCRNTSHIRRDCRVPRCAVFRRYGHDETECVKTYASVTGPAPREDVADLLMDEADVDESFHVQVLPADTFATPTEQAYIASKVATVVTTEQKAAVQTSDGKGKEETAIELASAGASTAEHGPATAMMDVADTSASSAATKRARDVTSGQEEEFDNETKDEPPQKTQVSRRASIRPKPNIPPDRRTAAEPPT
ncbi:uncharacterized protein LOC125943287 [Dermacentor silvarum]|uniref:uncharacterized protein LOC125943287 n=1 Tax=Dermacentor silvarum TaxID=543639 RepID=UPI002101D45D|nr:uncharacterized protein LOC125943287 [Dermacentor silvarum]